jgi:antitoxin YefM
MNNVLEQALILIDERDLEPGSVVNRCAEGLARATYDYAAWQEMAYLFRSPANARRLLDAAEAADRGETAEHPLDRT